MVERTNMTFPTEGLILAAERNDSILFLFPTWGLLKVFFNVITYAKKGRNICAICSFFDIRVYTQCVYMHIYVFTHIYTRFLGLRTRVCVCDYTPANSQN